MGGLIRGLALGITGKPQRVPCPELGHMGTSPERPEGKIGSLGLIELWPDRFLKKTVGKGEGEWGFSRTQTRQEEATGRVYECGLGVVGQLAVHGGSKRSRVSSGSH